MRADEAHAFQWRRLYQFVIQGGERQSLAWSELKINSIIETQPVRPRERQHGSVLGQGRMIDRETFEDPKKTRRVIFRQTPAALSLQRDVANLKPPVQWDERAFAVALQQVPRSVGAGVMFVLEAPAADDRCIKDERHDYLRPSSRQARISSTVARPAVLRNSLISAIARSASARRSSSSRTRRAIGLPCRVMTMVSPRST